MEPGGIRSAQQIEEKAGDPGRVGATGDARRGRTPYVAAGQRSQAWAEDVLEQPPFQFDEDRGRDAFGSQSVIPTTQMLECPDLEGIRRLNVSVECDELLGWLGVDVHLHRRELIDRVSLA